MEVDWPDAFDAMLQDLDRRAEDGDEQARRKLNLLAAQIAYLERLVEEPYEDTMTLKRVRQSRIHPLWRLSHPYVDGVAVRTIVWFMDPDRAVVALFAADKASMGDVFYDSVGTRADQTIDRFIQEKRNR